MIQKQIRRKTKKVLIFFSLLLFTLTNFGCWDVLEIDKRGFVLGIAIDKGQEDELEITYQFAVPALGAEGGGFGSQRNVTTVAKSIQQGMSIVSSRSSLTPSLGHLKVIIIDEKVAKDNISVVLDFFERNSDSRLQTKVLLAQGKAKDILEVESYRGIPIAMAIAETFHNITLTDRIVGGSSLRVLGQKIENNNATLLVRGTPGKDEVKLAGSGVIKGNKLVGWLGEKETIFSGWLLNYIDGGTLTVPMAGIEKGYYSFREMGGNRRLVTGVSEGQPWARFELEMEGSITEMPSYEMINDSLNNKGVEQIEKELEDYVKMNSEDLIRKTQEKWKADVFQVGNSFRRYHPDAWDELAPRWEEFYRNMPIEVTVDIKIRRLGLKD